MHSGVRWLAITSDPASSTRRFAADSACPGCGRNACRSGANTASVPSNASTLIATTTSAVRNSRRRSAHASTNIPNIPSVPLISASPSFSSSTTGTIPAAANARPAGCNSPTASRTSPSPIAASAQCASGARSPEQPSDPNSRTTGVIPADNIAAYTRAVSSRTPVRPVASVDRRSNINARTTSRSTSGPDPAACDRTRLRCNWPRSSTGMCRVANAPNPVDTP